MKNPKLFKVTISTTLYVLAENQNDAIDVAIDNIDDETSYADSFANEIKNESEIDPEWVDALPYIERYSDAEELTCKQFIKNKNAKA